ncbi:hypothetical protein B0H15DRAFT_292091 [Mycena belliarum]|uniref:Zn(2)-C6 fungal-type domain-containing protein n=1 Tax=Mycena belliarum TaxID=1033014 RepID=A0AAD6U8H7_9AGAR|nr:hypothetical protein B0H15DRAFT_292091 [Mycena belliae]
MNHVSVTLVSPTCTHSPTNQINGGQDGALCVDLLSLPPANNQMPALRDHRYAGEGMHGHYYSLRREESPPTRLSPAATSWPMPAPHTYPGSLDGWNGDDRAPSAPRALYASDYTAEPAMDPYTWQYPFESAASDDSSGSDVEPQYLDLPSHSRYEDRVAPYSYTLTNALDESAISPVYEPVDSEGSRSRKSSDDSSLGNHLEEPEPARPRTGRGQHPDSPHNLGPYAPHLGARTTSYYSYDILPAAPLPQPISSEPFGAPYLPIPYDIRNIAHLPTIAEMAGWPHEFPNCQRRLIKKQALACLFCRERKIGCCRPDSSEPPQACKQCLRRKIECEYPTESRRGTHPRTRNSKKSASADVEAGLPRI